MFSRSHAARGNAVAPRCGASPQRGDTGFPPFGTLRASRSAWEPEKPTALPFPWFPLITLEDLAELPAEMLAANQALLEEYFPGISDLLEREAIWRTPRPVAEAPPETAPWSSFVLSAPSAPREQ